MNSRLIQKTVCLLCSIVIISTLSLSQEISKEDKKAKRQAMRQEKIDKGKLMITPLAGPAYTPELEFTLAGGIMLSFKTNPKDMPDNYWGVGYEKGYTTKKGKSTTTDEHQDRYWDRKGKPGILP